MKRVLAINPGSTSTKIAVYEGEKQMFQKNLTHSVEELAKFGKITEQFDFRKDAIVEALKENNIELDSLAAIVGRGGLIKPVPSGVFSVNEAMKNDIINSEKEHASNLGALIADDLAASIDGANAYIADPVVVDEMQDVARITGHPNFHRLSIFHALNQKAVARRHAKEQGKKYEDLNLIVVHLGGGISVGAHQKGKVIDVNNALDGDGPFSPERTGTLPCGEVAKLSFSGKYTHDEIKLMIKGKGGLAAYLGTNDAREVSKRADEGDKEAALIQDAMIYQVAKEIGSLLPVLYGECDGVLMTGGIAHNKYFTDSVEKRVGKMAPVFVYPGEDEMGALAMNGLRVLNGETEALEYN